VPRIEGVRERVETPLAWLTDLEPGQRVEISAQQTALVDNLATSGGVIVNDNTISILDLRCNYQDVVITISIGEKPHRFVGPWLVEQTFSIHRLLQIYHDAALEKRDDEAMKILNEVLEKGVNGSRGLVQPLVVPARQPLRIFAELLPGVKAPRDGVEIYLRCLLTRDVR
jgi:hypothetical protein